MPLGLLTREWVGETAEAKTVREAKRGPTDESQMCLNEQEWAGERGVQASAEPLVRTGVGSGLLSHNLCQAQEATKSRKGQLSCVYSFPPHLPTS